MAGNTNSIGLTINSSNPLTMANGGIGRSVTPTSGSVLFYDATGVQQNNTNFFWDNTNDNLYIGANTSTTLDIPGRVVIRGTASSITNGSDIVFYNTADSHPLLQILPYLHDNVGINFDAYYNGINWISSFSSSQFQIYKLSSQLQFNYASATQGSTFTWTTGLTLNTTGQVNIANLTVSSLVQTDASKNLISSNTLSSTVLGNITKVTVTKLTSGSGTYTPPANCTHIKVMMWGGGGGGGGVAGNAASGGAAGGGASGGYIESIVTSPTSTSYSVGAAGTGGAAGNNIGNTGGNTTFGTFTASGGGGGNGYVAGLSAGVALGGQPVGNSGSPNISYEGNPGFPSIVLSTTIAVSGGGAPAPCGGGGAPPSKAGGAGLPGNSIGAGGAGAVTFSATSFAGGNGVIGEIVIEEYYNG